MSAPPPNELPARPPERPVAQIFQDLGVPKSVLNYRLRLPSRNWLVFLSITGSLLGTYIYDRRECRKIRDSYKERVAHLALEPLASYDMPRKVAVYACKPPGDEEHDRSMKYFKKYVKPILVAAAVDYEIFNGRRYGELAQHIAHKIKLRRRVVAGIDPEPPNFIPIPGQLTPAQKLAREAEAGTVIVGRHTFKEFLHGMKEGWTSSLEHVDEEEELAQELSLDGVFDEPEDEQENPAHDQTTRLAPPAVPQLLPQLLLHPPKPRRATIPAHLDVPPAVIPQQAPLLLVPFSNVLGFRNIPWMIADFFTERKRVRAGSEAAYQLIMGHTRPFDSSPEHDLDFDLGQEDEYLASFDTVPDDVAKTRREYYEALAKKITVARELSRGTRPPTKEETNYPPPTEVELRAERLQKEKRWRERLCGWSILRAGAPPAWDERFEGAFKVYIPPESEAGKPVQIEQQ